MTKMSTTKPKTRTRSGGPADVVLANRVKELRTRLGLLQAQFAERLGVSRTQVVEWENGAKVRPSLEKLILMAKLAPDAEARMWFWAKAGVNLDALKADFREDLRLRTEFG